MFMEKIKAIFYKRVVHLTVLCSLLIFLLLNLQLFAQNQSEVLRFQAQQQIDNGKFGEAINLLNRYISANPNNAVGYNLRGLCFENRKEYENAVYDFRSALKLEPDNKTIKENLNRTVEKWETLLYIELLDSREKLK